MRHIFCSDVPVLSVLHGKPEQRLLVHVHHEGLLQALHHQRARPGAVHMYTRCIQNRFLLQTIEILMSELDTEIMDIFHQHTSATAKEAREVRHFLRLCSNTFVVLNEHK